MLRATVLALVATVAVASPAAARPWNVRAVPATGATLSRGLDVLPSGRTAVLLQRHAGTQNRLELRMGGRTRLLDRSPSGFLDTAARRIVSIKAFVALK